MKPKAGLSTLAIIAATNLAAAGCCTRELVDAAPSPDESITAVQERKNCGATAAFLTEVTLRRGPLGLRSRVILQALGGPGVVLEWRSSRLLAVLMHPNAPEPATRVRQWGDVRVEYERVPPEGLADFVARLK